MVFYERNVALKGIVGRLQTWHNIPAKWNTYGKYIEENKKEKLCNDQKDYFLIPISLQPDSLNL